MNARQFIVLVLLALCQPLPAAEPDEADVEELGRIFMSPAERAELDRLRIIPPAVVSAGGINARVAESVPDPGVNASGFIIRAEGEAYLWVDGDFRKVRTEVVDQGLSKQKINVTRHKRTPAPAVVRPAAADQGNEASR